MYTRRKTRQRETKKQAANFRNGVAIEEIAIRCNEDDDRIRMKKFALHFGISILPFSPLILVGLLVAAVSRVSTELVGIERYFGGTPMHAVQFTQKGYIQVRIGRDVIRGKSNFHFLFNLRARGAFSLNFFRFKLVLANAN